MLLGVHVAAVRALEVLAALLPGHHRGIEPLHIPLDFLRTLIELIGSIHLALERLPLLGRDIASRVLGLGVDRSSLLDELISLA